MISACMLFDSKYSIEAWLSYSVIREFCNFMHIYILCMDERVYKETLHWQHFNGDIIPIRLYDFENYYTQLLNIRGTRSWPAYTQTCKTFLPTYIFDKYKEDNIFYMDSDILFWKNPQFIEKIFGDFSFMVCSRECVPRPPQGGFNAGFFVCKNDENAKDFLSWWQNKTIDWCEWRCDGDGLFGEEGYLNIIEDEPEKFKNILICPNPGVNLAHWNVGKHKLEIINDNIKIDEQFDLICFHYQNMQTKTVFNYPTPEIEFIYETYRAQLLDFYEQFKDSLFFC